jgi:hypothetical protein
VTEEYREMPRKEGEWLLAYAVQNADGRWSFRNTTSEVEPAWDLLERIPKKFDLDDRNWCLIGAWPIRSAGLASELEERLIDRSLSRWRARKEDY